MLKVSARMAIVVDSGIFPNAKLFKRGNAQMTSACFYTAQGLLSRPQSIKAGKRVQRPPKQKPKQVTQR